MNKKKFINKILKFVFTKDNNCTVRTSCTDAVAVMTTRSEIISSGMTAKKKSRFDSEFNRQGNRFCQVVLPAKL